MFTTPHITKRAVTAALATAALSLGLATSASAAKSDPAPSKAVAKLVDRATPPPDRPAKRKKAHKPKRKKATVNSAAVVTIGGQDIAWRELVGCTGALRANWGYFRYCVYDAIPLIGPAIQREWHYQYWSAGQYNEWFTIGCNSQGCAYL
jgi:hypothetical protein